MRVLVAFEFSARVRDAFIARGHDAWSCDVRPTEGRAGNHLQGDIRWALEGRLDRYPGAISIQGRTPSFRKWDLLIAHPPCTRLTNAGVRWLSVPPPGKTVEQMWAELDEGVELFKLALNADVPRIAVENPVPHHFAVDRIGRSYDQIVQPWQYGQGETKKTCLWLKNLPPLVPTNIVEGRKPVVHHEPPGPEREKNRSRTCQGIADAMADQWGRLL